jgi:transcriptional regulator with XRE-family HTH domain
MKSDRSWATVNLDSSIPAAPEADPDALDVARRIRTLVVPVSAYESGRTRPRAKVVRDLATVLEVDVLAGQ